MIGTDVDKLVSAGGAEVASIKFSPSLLEALGEPGDDLAELLRRKNGFYAFESSLLVRPWDHQTPPLGILQWNTPTLWKARYLDMSMDTLCFSEDVFGVQYCIHQGRIKSFDPETGLFNQEWGTLNSWARDILNQRDVMTAFPIAHAWQAENGPLAVGDRLIPKTLFVLGGAYDLGNLYVLNDAKSMQFRATIANQIRDVPDGQQVRITTERPH